MADRLAREALGRPWLLIGLVFASSCAYAAAALSLAVAAFKHESVLFRV